MVLRKRNIIVAGAGAALAFGSYQGISSFNNGRRTKTIPYTIVDGRGNRLASLFTRTAAPPDQAAYFRRYSSQFGKWSGSSCPTPPTGVSALWNRLSRNVTAFLGFESVYAQSCATGQSQSTSCPDNNCVSETCVGAGPGCQLIAQACLCYTTGCS